MNQRTLILLALLAGLLCQGLAAAPATPGAGDTNSSTTRGDLDFYPGDYSRIGLIGNSLPGSWRPFAPDSPWNTPLPSNAATHPDSERIMKTMRGLAGNLRLAARYSIPVWVVNAANMPGQHLRSEVTSGDSSFFNSWDANNDHTTDVTVPISAAT